MFAQKHDVGAIAVYNQKETQHQNVAGLQLLPYRKQNFVGRASYGYDSRYMIEGSFGMTGSENFASGHRWGFFQLWVLHGISVTRNSSEKPKRSTLSPS